MENQNLVDQVKAKPLGLVVGVVAILLFLAAAAWWAFSPTYVALSKEASEASQAEILSALTNSGIPYRINSKDGLIEVPEGSLSTARIQLAQAGVLAQSGAGYELFDHADYGMSEFSQKINYQRALEGELARSIMSMKEIRQARVHLTFKKTSLYQQDKEPAKASVIVQLRPEAALSGSQIAGIQQLIASAVDGLTQDSVVVLNESGQVLSMGNGATAVPDHLQLTSKVEQDLRSKAEQLLTRSFGMDNAYVSVRVQMNFDKMTAVRERPLLPAGDQGVVLREKESHSSSGTAAANSEAATNAHNQDSSETEYMVGKEHSEVEYATGKIEKISVGVILSPSAAVVDAKKMQDLLEATLGLSSARGDRLSIVYLPMAAPQTGKADVAAPAAPLPAPSRDNQFLSMSMIFWLVVSVVLTILMVVLVRGKNHKPAPGPVVPAPLSTAEREQLLQELRHWLKAPVKDQQP